MGNYSTSIDESFETGARDPYSLSHMIISWIVGVPIIILSVFLIITLIGPGQLPKSIRIVLINIQAAVIAFAVMGLITVTLFVVKALFRFSSPIGSFNRIGIACRKMVS